VILWPHVSFAFAYPCLCKCNWMITVCWWRHALLSGVKLRCGQILAHDCARKVSYTGLYGLCVCVCVCMVCVCVCGVCVCVCGVCVCVWCVCVYGVCVRVVCVWCVCMVCVCGVCVRVVCVCVFVVCVCVCVCCVICFRLKTFKFNYFMSLKYNRLQASYCFRKNTPPLLSDFCAFNQTQLALDLLI